MQYSYYLDSTLWIQVCQFVSKYVLNFICRIVKFHSHHFTIFCKPLVFIKWIKNQTNLQNFVCQCALALPFVLRLRGQWTRLSYWWWIIKHWRLSNEIHIFHRRWPLKDFKTYETLGHLFCNIHTIYILHCESKYVNLYLTVYWISSATSLNSTAITSPFFAHHWCASNG